MSFLDEQMDAMILDPTSEKQFLGNTYKWWASFLAAEEAVMPLNQQSFPVCLIHGVEDSQIPIQSADLAADSLVKTNALTYLRLEGYGHDLDTADVQDAACRWLGSVLFGQEPLNDTFIAQTTIFAPTSSQEAQMHLSEYIFSRGKKEESHGDVYGSTKVDRDSDGNEKASADVGVKHDFGNGWSADIRGGVSGSKDKDGNVKGEIHGEARINGRY